MGHRRALAFTGKAPDEGVKANSIQAKSDQTHSDREESLRLSDSRAEQDGAADAKAQIAVALTYDPQHDGAPRVVASGRGAVADQILNLAFAHGVKVRTDADLVQILSAVEVDSIIPLEAFAAVAEILAYVYQCNDRAKPDGLHANAASGFGVEGGFGFEDGFGLDSGGRS